MLKTAALIACLSVASIGASAGAPAPPGHPQLPVKDLRQKGEAQGGEAILAVFRDHWLAKVKESNFATLRPGSVYDLVVIFEQKFGLPRPLFNYFFTDTGLGTAEPLYPVFQTGYQKSWAQLIGSSYSEAHRHVDHYSSLVTPEGCRSDSTYWVRSIDKFPQYKAEMDQGYTLVDISFDYMTKLKPSAECGRHRANEPSGFRPNEYMKRFADKFQSPDDVPPEIRKKFEFKINVLKLVSRDKSRDRWPRYRDEYSFQKNSLWYYPSAHPLDFGVRTPRPQPGLQHYNLPSDNVIPLSEELRAELGLERFVSRDDFAKLHGFLRGEPFPGFDPRKEPGLDTLDIGEVTSKNIYTHGIEIEPILDAPSDTANPGSFALVSAVVRPRESVPYAESKYIEIPQLRLVFQMMNPSGNGRPVEQLYLHATYDAVDRYAPEGTRRAQQRTFLEQLDHLTGIRKSGQAEDAAVRSFLLENTAKPMMSLNFSSSLTGTWVFGSLSRELNARHELLPVKVVRQGIDVGYYSTVFDNELFRAAAKTATGRKKELLEEHLRTLSPLFYRDPRRFDTQKITFNKMTCAQCHQMSGRDAVHISLNDGLDMRKKMPVIASEYLIRELDRQMRAGR